jgi:hypothetical protein
LSLLCVPAQQALGDEVHLVVEANRLLQAMPGDDLFEDTSTHSDGSDVSLSIANSSRTSPSRIFHGPTPAAAVQRVAHEVHRPYRILQREVRIHPFEPAVLVFQLLPPFHILGAQPAERDFSLGLKPYFPMDRPPGTHLFQDRHDWRFGELSLAAWKSPGSGGSCAR